MKPTSGRGLIRVCGFSTGVLVSLIFRPPWNDFTRPDLLSHIVLAFSAGCMGLIVAEVARKFIPQQRQLENAEEHSLAETEIRKLMSSRRWGRLTGLVLGLAIPFIIYPWREIVASPATIAWLCLFWALTMTVAAEIVLSLNPKQQILTRILRNKK